MPYLLDTHTFLWMAASPEKLSARARRACESGELVLSVASIWETAIQYQIGNLSLPEAPKEFFARNIRLASVSVMPIHYRHALTAAALVSEHKDPFDRLLAAQSIEEDLACISIDGRIEELGAKRLW
ncbi:MAG TPA: type II toxin-antitoxin system VapC family toxin [Bryobacteraceae bacterium]|nr:type II toxin-antitoxin system VapC family toxin [Bryobacteraceae bacterium]